MNWFNNKTRNLNYINNNMSEDLTNTASSIGNKQKDIENISKLKQDDLNIESIIREKFDLLDKIYLSKKKIQEILVNKNISFTSMELDNIYRIATKKNLNEITFDSFLNNLISSNKINNYFRIPLKDNFSPDNEKFTNESNKLTEAIIKINNKNDLNENQINLNSKILKNEIDKIHKIISENAKDINYLSNRINQDKIIEGQNMQDSNNTNNLNRDFFRLIMLEEEQKKNLLDLQTDKLKRFFFNEIRSLYNFNNNSITDNRLNDINMHSGSYNLNSTGNHSHCNPTHFKNRNEFPINNFRKHNQNYDMNNILYNPQNENDYNWKNIYESSESKLNNLENLILNLYDKFDKISFFQKQTEQNKSNEVNNFENKFQNLNKSRDYKISNDSHPDRNLDDHSNTSDDNVFSLRKELEKTNPINTFIKEINNSENISLKDIDFDDEKKKINFKKDLFFANKLNENNFENKFQNLNKSRDYKISNDSHPNRNLDDHSNTGDNNVFSLCKELEKTNPINTSIKETNNSENTISKDIDFDNEKKKIDFKKDLFFTNKLNENNFDKLEFLLEGLRKKIDDNSFLFDKNKKELINNEKENINKINNDFNNNLFWNQELENNKLKDEKIKDLENTINELKKEIDQYSNTNVNSIETLLPNFLSKQIGNTQDQIKEVKDEIESKFNSLSGNLNKDKENSTETLRPNFLNGQIENIQNEIKEFKDGIESKFNSLSRSLNNDKESSIEISPPSSLNIQIENIQNKIKEVKDEIESKFNSLSKDLNKDKENSIEISPPNSLSNQIENIQSKIKEVKDEIESKFNFLSNDLNKDKENLINKIELFFEKNSIESKNINEKLLLDNSTINHKDKFVYLNFDDNNNFSKVNEIFKENNLTLKNNKSNTETLDSDYSTKITNLENSFNKKINLDNTNSNIIQNESDKITEKNLLFEKFNNDTNSKNYQTSNFEFHNQQENNSLSSKIFLNNKEKNLGKNPINKSYTENILNETMNDNKYFNSSPKEESENYIYENNTNHYLGDNINNYRELLEKDFSENSANDNIDDFLSNLDKKITNNVKDLSNIKNILNGENIDKQVLSDLDISISLFDSMSKN